MERFAIRASLRTPAIIGRRLCLDALLAAQEYLRHGDADRAHAGIPLRLHHGVWCGSAAWLEGPVIVGQEVRTQSLRAQTDLSLREIAPGHRKGQPFLPKIQVASGPYRNRQTVYRTVAAAAVWWTGEGDLDAVRALLSPVTAIGTKANVGHGSVAAWEFVKLPPGAFISGWTDVDGQAVRPVPAEAWAAAGLPRDDQVLAVETWSPPYWQSTPTTCVVPPAPMTGSLREIQRRIGLSG